MMRLLAFAVLGLALLSGCASISREECQVGDWAAIGERDGADGRVADTQFGRHVSACAKVDIIPDRAAWEQGYATGLRSYCTPQTGLREGEAGRPYRNVCPSADEAGFLLGHDLGLSAYRQRARIEEIRREIAQLQRFSSVRSDDPLSEGAARRARQASQSEILMLRLDESMARAQLLRIEREIRAFRAAL